MVCACHRRCIETGITIQTIFFQRDFPTRTPVLVLQFRVEQECVVVFVVSTTGDGDPPDNVAKFWRKLKRKTLPSDHLGSCNYALLGKTCGTV